MNGSDPHSRNYISTVVSLSLSLSFLVPLVSRICPSDTYRVWKSGQCLRVDTTLMGFDQMTWQRGNRSFIFRGQGQGSGAGVYVCACVFVCAIVCVYVWSSPLFYCHRTSFLLSPSHCHHYVSHCLTDLSNSGRYPVLILLPLTVFY